MQRLRKFLKIKKAQLDGMLTLFYALLLVSVLNFLFDLTAPLLQLYGAFTVLLALVFYYFIRKSRKRKNPLPPWCLLFFKDFNPLRAAMAFLILPSGVFLYDLIFNFHYSVGYQTPFLNLFIMHAVSSIMLPIFFLVIWKLDKKERKIEPVKFLNVALFNPSQTIKMETSLLDKWINQFVVRNYQIYAALFLLCGLTPNWLNSTPGTIQKIDKFFFFQKHRYASSTTTPYCVVSLKIDQEIAQFSVKDCESCKIGQMTTVNHHVFAYNSFRNNRIECAQDFEDAATE